MKKKLILPVAATLLAGCSAIGGVDRSDPIDNALKACGLGYSSDVGVHFRAAYEYAEQNGGANFEAKFAEGLETQVGAIAKNQSFNNGLSSEGKVDLIKSTQSCVVKFANTYRPKTRSELISNCMDDLHSRASGKGSRTQVVTLKNWVVVKDHPLHSDENPIVQVTIDRHSTYNSIMTELVQCKSENYEYSGLESVDR